MNTSIWSNLNLIQNSMSSIIFLTLIFSSSFEQIYLQRFGYMNESGAANLIAIDKYQDAIKDFQRFSGINETGKLPNWKVWRILIYNQKLTKPWI